MEKTSVLAKAWAASLKLKSWRENVKVDLRIPNRQLFMLVLVVEEGLAASNPEGLLPEVLTEEDRQGLRELVKELLTKGDFEEFYTDYRKMAKG